MSYLQPWMLWALPTVLLPIIIHLLNRLRYRTVHWGAMMFLLRANKAATRRAKIRQYLLLLFRALVILFLIWAMSRPITGGWIGKAAGGASEVVLVVLDRSASMGEPDGQPLAAAKRELVRSLDELVDSQQFGIVFYNERTRVFAPNGGVVRPVFAAAESRRQAQAFIADVPAAGGTRHAEAIATALRIGADVVFVLTDGDAEHDLTAGELRSLSRAAGGTRIMVVQFGDGATGRSPRLAELAAETGGTYAVVDPDT